MFGHRAIDHNGWRAVCPWPGPSFAEAEVPFGTAITAETLAGLDAERWERDRSRLIPDRRTVALSSTGLGSVGAPQSHVERATVRVKEGPVDRCGEPAMPGGQLAFPADGMAAQEPGRSRPVAPAVMPSVELRSALADGVRGPLGVEQVIVLVHAEVFAHHGEAQLASEPPGSIPQPAGIGGGTLVAFGVHHRSGQLRVVGPGPRVEVVAAHRRPHVVDDA